MKRIPVLIAGWSFLLLGIAGLILPVLQGVLFIISDEPITAREIEVLQQIAGGNRNRDIAEKLFISEETVKVHIKHIMEKLEASDRTQAVAIAVRRGIIQL
jgi:DNA-binding NarL/FixJ family response regulator